MVIDRRNVNTFVDDIVDTSSPSKEANKTPRKQHNGGVLQENSLVIIGGWTAALGHPEA